MNNPVVESSGGAVVYRHSPFDIRRINVRLFANRLNEGVFAPSVP